MNLPVVRQFLFQQGDLPPPLIGAARIGMGGGGAALAAPPMPAVMPGQLEEEDED